MVGEPVRSEVAVSTAQPSLAIDAPSTNREASLSLVHRRATRFISILAVDAVSTLLDHGMRAANLNIFGATAIIGFIALATVVSFLQWLHAAYRAAEALGVPGLRFTASGAVWSFFIPIVGFYRPYQLVLALNDQLAPDTLALPPPQADPAGEHGYREPAAMWQPPVTPPPPVLFWWLAWVTPFPISLLLLVFRVGPSLPSALLFAALNLMSAWLVMLVVRRTTDRIFDRMRRLKGAEVVQTEVPLQRLAGGDGA